MKLAREKEPLEANADDQNEQADPRDFEQLVSQHLDFVWRLLRRFGLAPADADDVAQRVFMIAFAKLGEQPAGKERAFLYGTARRLAANARRALDGRREVPDLSADALIAPGASLDEQIDLTRAANLLDDLVARLPEELGRVWVLAELEDATVPAIAELEGIPVGTAASRLRRAREAFSKLLQRAARQNPFGGGP